MSKLQALKSQILVRGEDLCLDEADVTQIRECLPADGTLPSEDLLALAEMRSEAQVVCPAFDELFFPAFKTYLLADGTISRYEQFLLLRMLYGGGQVDDAERQFLQELRQEARTVSPEFEAMYQQAMND